MRFSKSSIEFTKSEFFISFLISDPSNTPAFNFSTLSLGHDLQMYLQQLPSLFRALRNCFLSPNLMSNKGKMILSLGTRASLITFLFHRSLTLEMATPSLCSALLSLYRPTCTKNRNALCNHSVYRAENSPSSNRHISTICDGSSKYVLCPVWWHCIFLSIQLNSRWVLIRTCWCYGVKRILNYASNCQGAFSIPQNCMLGHWGREERSLY